MSQAMMGVLGKIGWFCNPCAAFSFPPLSSIHSAGASAEKEGKVVLELFEFCGFPWLMIVHWGCDITCFLWCGGSSRRLSDEVGAVSPTRGTANGREDTRTVCID